MVDAADVLERAGDAGGSSDPACGAGDVRPSEGDAPWSSGRAPVIRFEHGRLNLRRSGR